ncbi:acyl-CoA dehydrogenase family protein [Amorphus orientalis]|uniref:Alkylation response protein AidB-like acyl-CoA dehydrogenase n=1 Tax=Amorphus orientalis TaxID=649198 RepID=A0AAE3VM51_9HYPH|nr:acyl-CoA dehydrogenase family protein [Amorphus orientalis]MDQ0314588.1 alkylation response protein AidB-like acyl-CoA dehydrogenase [Amorphus orientalis]
MDLGFSDEQTLLRDSVRRLMDRHAPPEMVARHDREGTYPYDLYRAWAEAGLFALPFSEADGGLGGSVIDLAIVGEEIAYTSADFYMAYAGGVFCGLNIARKGSEAQKARFLPPLIAGDLRMAISISEADAGSDVGAMRTRAVRDGDAWVVDGTKLWSTGAGVKNTLLNVYLKTDPSVSHRKGMSLVLIDNDAPGVELKKLDMLGRTATGTYEISFDGVRIGEDRIIGGVNGGWDCILSGLQVERIVSAAGNCGAARAVVDLAADYARTRTQFGKPIGSNQAIAHMIADMQTEVAAARALMWQAAWKVSAGEDALAEISMAKLFSSETYAKVANQGMQIMGAFGYSMEFPMQRHYRDSRSATIAAGSSQMQRNLIAGLMGLKVN